MRRFVTSILALVALAALAWGCAGPAKLARQSQEALAEGDLRKAHDRARRAIEKDPQNLAAREAYLAVSERLAADYRGRVRRLAAATDTLAAADLALEFAAFRDAVHRHPVALAPEPAYAADEQRIRAAAARGRYREGRAALEARQPKQAWRLFGQSLVYDPAHPDAARRQQQAWQKALARVAMLPFTEQVGIAGLAEHTSTHTARELMDRSGTLTFTQWVDPAEVGQRLTLAQARGMDAREAAAFGRRVGADRVVRGRVGGVRTDHTLAYFDTPVFRRVARTDEAGRTQVTWQEHAVRCLLRSRDVTVRWSYDVLDARAGTTLAERTLESTTTARVVWSDFRPEGAGSDYVLLPPDVRRADPARARAAEQRWRDALGDWTVSELVQACRDQRQRLKWTSRMRGEFRGGPARRPVWLGELPGEEDLAFVVLETAWQPMLETLAELDARDTDPAARPVVTGEER